MRKSSYDFESKRLYRDELRNFIQKHYPNEIDRINLRVACLPGHEGLEVTEVYLPLGIRPTRITGIEENPAITREIVALNLGINLYQGSAQSFFEKNSQRFDIVNLDFQSQFGNEEVNTLCALCHNHRLKNRAIFATNFYGSRENDQQQEAYAHTVSFFIDGGATVRVSRGMKSGEAELITSALTNNRAIQCNNLQETRDTMISMRLRYMLSANSVQETLNDLLQDSFLKFYVNSIHQEGFPKLETIMTDPAKHIREVCTIAAIKDFYIMRVFHEAFPHNKQKQASLHAFWETLQLRRPFFITDFYKGRYVSDTGSPMLYDFLYIENMEGHMRDIAPHFDRAEEGEKMRFTFIEKSALRKNNFPLRPLTENEGILFGLSKGDTNAVYRRGGLFIKGSQNAFWRSLDSILEAHVLEINYLLDKRKDLVVTKHLEENNVPKKEDLPTRLGYLSREMHARLPRTHQKALAYFMEDISKLPERKQHSLEKAFLSSRFEEQIQLPIEDVRFYAFLDDLRARIVKHKPITSEVINSYYASVRDASPLVEVIPFQSKKAKEGKARDISEEVKREIRQLRQEGYESKDIYHHLQGKGISITRRQCGSTAAWMHQSFAARKKRSPEVIVEAAA